MEKVIAIDFDNTLFYTDFPTIIKPRKNVIDKALEEQKKGAKLILWTCREGMYLADALAACHKAGLCFDAVNTSLPDWTCMWGTDPRKIGATEYWDDRAVNPNADCRFACADERVPLEQVLDDMYGDKGVVSWAAEFYYHTEYLGEELVPNPSRKWWQIWKPRQIWQKKEEQHAGD